jgi:hypothetical protein
VLLVITEILADQEGGRAVQKDEVTSLYTSFSETTTAIAGLDWPTHHRAQGNAASRRQDEAKHDAAATNDSNRTTSSTIPLASSLSTNGTLTTGNNSRWESDAPEPNGQVEIEMTPATPASPMASLTNNKVVTSSQPSSPTSTPSSPTSSSTTTATTSAPTHVSSPSGHSRPLPAPKSTSGSYNAGAPPSAPQKGGSVPGVPSRALPSPPNRR